MSAKKNPCCVCGKPFKRTNCDWVHACEKCEPVWKICFTSADEGVKALKSADLKVLNAAFVFEQHRAGSRKTLRVALAREISRRIKLTLTRTGKCKGCGHTISPDSEFCGECICEEDGV